jgi:hypothetical protein
MKFLYTLLTLGLATQLSAQSTFVTTLSTTGTDRISAVAETSDSGYVMVGSTATGNTTDMMLAKVNKVGNLLWQKKIGGTANEEGLAIKVLPWGGIIATANTKSYGTGGDVMLVKMNADGDTLWTKVYGTNGDDYGRVLEITDGGNYRITGVFFAGGTNKPGILTVDSNGVFVASKFVANQFASPDYRAHYLHGNKMGITGGSQMMMFTDTLGVYSGLLNYGTAAKSIDACYLPGGYYAVVYWADFGSLNSNAGLFVADTNGTKIFNKKFSTADDDLPIWVKPDGKGGILLAVQRRDPNTYISKMAVINCDMQGNILWQQVYNTTANIDHQIGDVIPTSDGGYLVVGSYDSNGSFTNYNGIIIKTDSVGNSGCDATANNATAGTGLDNTPQSANSFNSALNANGLRVGPVTTSFSPTYTVRCSSVSTGISNVKGVTIEVYPNPAHDILYIKNAQVKDVAVRDLSGRVVMMVADSNSIDISSLQHGVYLMSVSYDKGSCVMTFVKE